MRNLYNSSKKQARKKPINNAKGNKVKQDSDQIQFLRVHLGPNL